MKKTPAILMTTALLSVPCAEGVAQTPTPPTTPAINTQSLRTTPRRPCKMAYYEIVSEFSHYSYTADEITDEMRFIDDLGYDSFSLLLMFQKIEEEIFNGDIFLDTPDDYEDSLYELQVGHVWEYILDLWNERYGEEDNK